MAVLDTYRDFAASPRTVVCPQMRLIAHDFEPPVLEGHGEFRCPSPNHFEYSMTGTPVDRELALMAILRLKSDPYDGLNRFRLLATDEEGRTYNLGWTVPKIIDQLTEWVCTDRLEGIHVDDVTCAPSARGSSEALFLIPEKHFAFDLLRRTMQAVPDFEPQRYAETLQVLDTSVHFTFEPDAGLLFIEAIASDGLPLPYTEDWLGEPLMMLFGQMAFPRLVSRNFDQGHSHLAVRRSPPWMRDREWVALYQIEDDPDGSRFWAHYTDVLIYIATARNERGAPNFERNLATRRYEEVIQAAAGSRWVAALTLASNIEGLVNHLVPDTTPRPEADDAAIASLCAHIERWLPDWVASVAADKSISGIRTDNKGQVNTALNRFKSAGIESADIIEAWKRLPSTASGAVRKTSQMNPASKMRTLQSQGHVTAEQSKAWSDVRHSVMHGHLVSPYSSPEEDRKLMLLADMMRRLTFEVIRRGHPQQVPDTAVVAT